MSYGAWSVIAGEQPTTSKWNILGTNDSSFNDGTGIGSGAIAQPAQLVAGSGTSWAWQTWTPTASVGITVGNSVVSGKYNQTGKTVTTLLNITLGTTGSATTAVPIITLPVTASADYGAVAIPIGTGRLQISGHGNYPTFVRMASTTTFDYVILSSSPVVEAAPPFAMATGDVITLSFKYEAA